MLNLFVSLKFMLHMKEENEQLAFTCITSSDIVLSKWLP